MPIAAGATPNISTPLAVSTALISAVVAAVLILAIAAVVIIRQRRRVQIPQAAPRVAVKEKPKTEEELEVENKWAAAKRKAGDKVEGIAPKWDDDPADREEAKKRAAEEKARQKAKTEAETEAETSVGEAESDSQDTADTSDLADERASAADAHAEEDTTEDATSDGIPRAVEVADEDISETERSETELEDAEEQSEEDSSVEEIEVEDYEAPSFRDRLSKARDGLAHAIGGLRGRRIDEEVWEELEEALILADVGVPTTMAMLDAVRERAAQAQITDVDDALLLLREEMEAKLADNDISLNTDGEPAVWMFVGVNGVGKTTTIGKLARRQVDAGQEVVLAAGDTFRAAAAEQLEMWADRSSTGFIRGAEGADPGSVIFDAIEHARANQADLVLADTAGRLHNKSNLMEELAKVRRISEKGSGKLSEVLLVIDATTGQNGLNQAKQFTQAVDVTGIVLTKLDGSAKGGIVLAIQHELGIPVKLVGLGEGVGDLVDFDAEQFVDALFV